LGELGALHVEIGKADGFVLEVEGTDWQTQPSRGVTLREGIA
jgi:hypothetical protein